MIKIKNKIKDSIRFYNMKSVKEKVNNHLR